MEGKVLVYVRTVKNIVGQIDSACPFGGKSTRPQALRASKTVG